MAEKRKPNYKIRPDGKKDCGKPTVMTPETLSKLEIAWLQGATDLEACFYANIATATLYNYQNTHSEYLDRKQRLKESMALKARSLVLQALEEGDKDMAKWYLERKKKEEFSTKVENSGINTGIVIQVASADQVNLAQQQIDKIINGELSQS